MNGHVRVRACVFVAALVLAACSSGSSGGSEGTSTPAGRNATEIVAQGFAFDPNSVNVSAGEITLSVTNNDSAEHTFTLDDGSSDTDLPAGETVPITLDLSTTVGWHCTIHPSMTGTLNVA